MPFQCSSYPVARETSFTDFWEPGADKGKANVSWKYVVVKNLACEGFGKSPGDDEGGEARLHESSGGMVGN